MNKDPIMYTAVTDVKINEITGEYYIEFDEDLLKTLDWNTDDVLTWTDNEDGTFTLSKQYQANKS